MIGANDFLEDVLGLGGPDKGFRIFVMHSDVLRDGGDGLRDAAKYTAPQPFGGDVTKGALDHLEPGRRRRGEMDMETGMLSKPRADLGMLVRRVVVADQMQGFVLGRFPINLAQKIQPFGVPMALCATRDHRAIQRIHGRERGRGPVTLVVMRHRLRASFLERQAGLGTIKRLYLAFLNIQVL